MLCQTQFQHEKVIFGHWPYFWLCCPFSKTGWWAMELCNLRNLTPHKKNLLHLLWGLLEMLIPKNPTPTSNREIWLTNFSSSTATLLTSFIHSCFVSDLEEEKAFAFHHWVYWLWALQRCHLLCWGKFLLYLICWEFLSKRVSNFVRFFFCTYWDDNVALILYSVNVG